MSDFSMVEKVVESYLMETYRIRSNTSSVSDNVIYETMTAFLKIEDLMKLLDLSRPTITRLIKSGELPAVRIGNQYRICKEDFEEFWHRKIQEQQEEYQKRVAFLDDYYRDLNQGKAGMGGRRSQGRKHKEYKQA